VVAGSGSRASALERYAWVGGFLYVAAFLAEAGISVAIAVNQDDSAAKIANALADHHERLVVVACLSVLYAVGFVVYLTRLDDLLRGASSRRRFLASWVLIGGILFVTLHAVSDIGITGMLGARVASYSAAHDQGLSFSLYYLTYALDSVADVFGSLAFLAAGLLILRTGDLPRRLGWVAVATAPFLLLQGFGLGGVIATFGLVLDLIGFLLLLAFVVATSVAGYRLASSRRTSPSVTPRPGG
jgi:hypothetical protein